VGIYGVHGDDYKYGKYILWCYCPRDGDFISRVCNMILTLKEYAKALALLATSIVTNHASYATTLIYLILLICYLKSL